MYYVYLLRSKKDKGFYVGFSSDLKSRFENHRSGEAKSTKYRRPLELVYYEAYKYEKLAREREGQLKRFSSAYNALIKRLKLK